MTILVTGSSGYLGKSFINTYQQHYTFQTFSLQQASLDTLDLSSTDIVLHSAALVHQKEEHPYSKYHEINTLYPVALASKAKQQGVKQFIFISTIAVYSPDTTYITSETKPSPETPYGKSKLEAEKQLSKLEDDTFKVTTLRIPMIYGKDAPGNIDALIKMIQKVPLLPFGGISNRRSFIYVGNATSTIHESIQHEVRGVVLIADEQPISTTELITSLASGMGKRIWLLKVPFFEPLLKRLKPLLYAKLYGDLELQANIYTCFPTSPLLYSVEEGLKETTKCLSHRKLYKIK